MAVLKLYDYPLSGNCYKVRLLLSMLGLEYERVLVDIKAGESLTPDFKKLNPRSQIPVLVDAETVLWDSMAILTYLARRYGDKNWLPSDALGLARVMQWLAVSENELLYGLARARATLLLGKPFNLELCQTEGRAGLGALEEHLNGRIWLAAAETPTIADIACYPYISLAHEGEVSLEPYPNVRQWIANVETLPGWVAMTPQPVLSSRNTGGIGDSNSRVSRAQHRLLAVSLHEKTTNLIPGYSRCEYFTKYE